MATLTKVGLDDFVELIEETTISVSLHASLAYKNDLALPGKLRGALGRRLLQSAAEGCVEAVNVLELLFNAGGNVSAPFCISVDECEGEIVISIRLFGDAGAFCETITSNFLEALAGERDQASLRVSQLPRSELRDCSWARTVGCSTRLLSDSATLRFKMPFKLGRGDELTLRYCNLWISALKRAQDIAIQHGFLLTNTHSEVLESSRRLIPRDDLLYPLRWDRWTSRHGGVRKEMAGYEGVLLFDSWQKNLSPLARLAEKFFIGGGTAFGLGRFELY